MFLCDMLVNASEETLTEIANIAYDSIVNGDFSQYETKVRQYVLQGMTETEAKKKAALDLGGQVVEAGASGALMGFGFGTIGSAPAVVRNAFNQVQSNRVLKGQEYDHLKGTALQTIDETLDPENTQTQKLTVQTNSGDAQTLRTLAEESRTENRPLSCLLFFVRHATLHDSIFHQIGG